MYIYIMLSYIMCIYIYMDIYIYIWPRVRSGRNKVGQLGRYYSMRLKSVEKYVHIGSNDT